MMLPNSLSAATRPARVLIPVFLVYMLATQPGQSADWPSWRGGTRSGVSAETDIPTIWTVDSGIRWRVPLPGSGISSPVVHGKRIFVTASDGPRQDNLHVICLDRDSGRVLWHQRLWGTSPTRYHSSKSSMASPTPVTDGTHVYTFFGTGDVFCFEVSGELVWQRSLAAEYGAFENRFSATSSPVIYKNLLIVQCDHYGPCYVIALERTTGSNRWKVDRPETWLSWSSPQLVTLSTDNSQELVICGSNRIDGLAPQTGRKLWSLGGLRHECIPTPVLAHGMIYAVSGPKGPTLAIRPGGRGDVSQSHVLWRNNRGAPFVPSAIVVGSLYYLVDDNGIATCLDAHTGANVWQKRLPGKYTASPVATRSHVYFSNESGVTTVIRANRRSYEEVSRNPVGAPIYASAAIAHGRLLLRTTRDLVSIDGTSESSTPPE
ncbi:MAG: PQQ-binding-like beta-propeller repeat protein [Planctomycetaceae bacterium]